MPVEWIRCIRMGEAMKATDFEVRHRLLLTVLLLWISYQVYVIDRLNITLYIVHLDPHHAGRGNAIYHAIYGFAALLIALGASLRTWASSYAVRGATHECSSKSNLICANGPYRYVRHPLYVGAFLVAIAIGCFESRLGFAILPVGAAILILRLVNREEADRAAEDQDAFQEYSRRVPRFLPLLRPRVPAGVENPDWSRAFRVETFAWGAFVTMVAFSIVLDDNIGSAFGLAAILAWGGSRFLMSGPRKDPKPNSDTGSAHT